jgi:hypothetical protein
MDKLAMVARIVKLQTFAISWIKEHRVANCKYAPNWQTNAVLGDKRVMAPQVAGPSPLREKLVEG